MPIGRLSVYALDCPDPRALAEFYRAVTGWEVDERSDDEWVQLESDGGPTVAFQRVADYRRPVWPGSEHPQQAHFDFDVTDLDAGEAALLEIGATKAEFQPGTTFRVYLDPVGHPFCLVLSAPANP
jgi:catechol 2,3-dioxygenase-like lactoylglutathione lyase family enzyme